jgi:hypothetical protein
MRWRMCERGPVADFGFYSDPNSHTMPRNILYLRGSEQLCNDRESVFRLASCLQSWRSWPTRGRGRQLLSCSCPSRCRAVFKFHSLPAVLCFQLRASELGMKRGGKDCSPYSLLIRYQEQYLGSWDSVPYLRLAAFMPWYETLVPYAS